jgi:hypothetical protein
LVIAHLLSPLKGIALANTLLCLMKTKPLIRYEYERKIVAKVNQTKKKPHGIRMPMELYCASQSQTLLSKFAISYYQYKVN